MERRKKKHRKNIHEAGEAPANIALTKMVDAVRD